MGSAGRGKAGSGLTSNSITGGVFFGAVVQGRDVQVVLPAEVAPAMTGMPAPARVFTGRDHQVETLLHGLAPEGAGGAVVVSAVAGMAGIGKTELVLKVASRALRRPGWRTRGAGGV